MKSAEAFLYKGMKKPQHFYSQYLHQGEPPRFGPLTNKMINLFYIYLSSISPETFILISEVLSEKKSA